MSFAFGKSKSKSSQNSSGTVTPTNPDWITTPIRQLTSAISGLGNTDASSYVSPASGLQKAAFGIGDVIAGRYGVSAPTGQTSAPASSSGLFSNLGVRDQGTPDYLAYGKAYPDVAASYGGMSPEAHAIIARRQGLSTKRVTPEQMYKDHYENFGRNEGRKLPYTGGVESSAPSSAKPSMPAGISAIMSGGSVSDPVQAYGDARDIASEVADAGPNTISTDGLSAPAASLLDNIGAYMSPYTDDVIDTTLAGFDENAGRVRAEQAASGAANDAFGGSRFAVREAITEENLARERASLEAGLRDEGFRFGAQLSDSDAGRRQQADQFGIANLLSARTFNADQADEALARSLESAGLMGQLASSQQNNERADLGLLAQLGEQQRAIDTQARTADLQLLSLMTQLYGSLPLGQFVGERQTGTVNSSGSQSVFNFGYKANGQ